MDWTIKLEARSGWGEVETIEVARFKRRVVGLTAEKVGLSLAEGKEFLAELQRLMLQTQMEEYAVCKRVCPECLKLRRQRDGSGKNLVSQPPWEALLVSIGARSVPRQRRWQC